MFTYFLLFIAVFLRVFREKAIHVIPNTWLLILFRHEVDFKNDSDGRCAWRRAGMGGEEGERALEHGYDSVK